MLAAASTPSDAQSAEVSPARRYFCPGSRPATLLMLEKIQLLLFSALDITREGLQSPQLGNTKASVGGFPGPAAPAPPQPVAISALVLWGGH